MELNGAAHFQFFNENNNTFSITWMIFFFSSETAKIALNTLIRLWLNVLILFSFYYTLLNALITKINNMLKWEDSVWVAFICQILHIF